MVITTVFFIFILVILVNQVIKIYLDIYWYKFSIILKVLIYLYFND